MFSKLTKYFKAAPPVPAVIPSCELNNIDDVRLEMARVYRRMRHGLYTDVGLDLIKALKIIESNFLDANSSESIQN